jgi:hypothetical protein
MPFSQTRGAKPLSLKQQCCAASACAVIEKYRILPDPDARAALAG